MAIEKGDKVRLKSGSPDMTVSSVTKLHQGSNIIEAYWYCEQDRKFKSQSFFEYMLFKVL